MVFFLFIYGGFMVVFFIYGVFMVYLVVNYSLF
jgi:hypothetical protein